ncbi:hypothetical protein H4R35_007063 [Dimargaris xerosporica]|nr:hypothetical protein H4R35_007063 [Dimargaris xerosporica]
MLRSFQTVAQRRVPAIGSGWLSTTSWVHQTKVKPSGTAAAAESPLPATSAAATANTAAGGTTSPESEANDTNASLPKRASSLVSSILHGSPKAKKEANDTFSRVLARGKYVHELVKHRIKPDCVDEYVQVVSEFYPRIVKDLQPQVKLCGSWLTAIGKLDTATHVWEFEGYPAHSELLMQLHTNPAYQEMQSKIQRLVRSRSNQIMLEFAFWPTSPPVVTQGLYELRSYQLKAGRLLEWESNWRSGIECRKDHEKPIGAWFSQLGQLNQVHHMWAYPDLETRRLNREEAWTKDGWAQTVYNTVRLIDEMHTSILMPLPYSPLK